MGGGGGGGGGGDGGWGRVVLWGGVAGVRGGGGFRGNVGVYVFSLWEGNVEGVVWWEGAG